MFRICCSHFECEIGGDCKDRVAADAFAEEHKEDKLGILGVKTLDLYRKEMADYTFFGMEKRRRL